MATHSKEYFEVVEKMIDCLLDERSIYSLKDKSNEIKNSIISVVEENLLNGLEESEKNKILASLSTYDPELPTIDKLTKQFGLKIENYRVKEALESLSSEQQLIEEAIAREYKYIRREE